MSPHHGPGSGPTQGVLAPLPEWEGMGFGPRAAGRERGRGGRKDSPCPLHRHFPAGQPHGPHPVPGHCAARSSAPAGHISTFRQWRHQDQDPFRPLHFKSNTSPAPCPVAQPRPPGSAPLNPAAAGATPASRASAAAGGSGHRRARGGVRGRCCRKWVREEEKGVKREMGGEKWDGDVGPEQRLGAEYKNARVHRLMSL